MIHICVKIYIIEIFTQLYKCYCRKLIQQRVLQLPIWDNDSFRNESNIMLILAQMAERNFSIDLYIEINAYFPSQIIIIDKIFPPPLLQLMNSNKLNLFRRTYCNRKKWIPNKCQFSKPEPNLQGIQGFILCVNTFESGSHRRIFPWTIMLHHFLNQSIILMN